MNHICTMPALSRRSFLQVGALGVSGLTDARFLQAKENASGKQGAEAAIVVLLEGGPSHIDTFDPKPQANTEIRGEFKAISTSIPGVQFCEHLPKLAAGLGDFALLRSVGHTLADHQLGRQYLMTGTRPLASMRYPEYGAVLSKARPSVPELPTSVAIPKTDVGPGFLGPAYSSFETHSFPIRGRALTLPSLALPPKLPLDRLDDRERLVHKLDARLSSDPTLEPALDSMGRFSRQAYAMLRSPKTREAFDLSRESQQYSAMFGQSQFGQGCLLAIRLVEAGVKCVTLTFGGWDSHQNLFPHLKNRLLPELDQGLSALFAGLRLRGMMSSTAVLVTGEFGRSPKINDRPNPGREHHARSMFMLLAGGRVAGGQVYGATDETGGSPTADACTPDDVAATYYSNLGIDPGSQFSTPEGRPITLVRNGAVLEQLLA